MFQYPDRENNETDRVKMSDMGRVSRVTSVQTALRNYTRDEGGPFGFGRQGLIPRHYKLLS